MNRSGFHSFTCVILPYNQIVEVPNLCFFLIKKVMSYWEENDAFCTVKL